MDSFGMGLRGLLILIGFSNGSFLSFFGDFKKPDPNDRGISSRGY